MRAHTHTHNSNYKHCSLPGTKSNECHWMIKAHVFTQLIPKYDHVLLNLYNFIQKNITVFLIRNWWIKKRWCNTDTPKLDCFYRYVLIKVNKDTRKLSNANQIPTNVSRFCSANLGCTATVPASSLAPFEVAMILQVYLGLASYKKIVHVFGGQVHVL